MAFLTEPGIIRPGTAPISVVRQTDHLPVAWVMLAVRDMGGASYVAFGTRRSQESRLVGNGDFYVLDVPGGGAFDAAQIFCRSDAVAGSEPTVEVWAMGADA